MCAGSAQVTLVELRWSYKEEEAATDDSVVEQQEEHEIASVWEVNDSSSVSSQGHYEPVDGVRSQSASLLPVASPCSQANEELDAPRRSHRSRKCDD